MMAVIAGGDVYPLQKDTRAHENIQLVKPAVCMRPVKGIHAMACIMPWAPQAARP